MKMFSIIQAVPSATAVRNIKEAYVALKNSRHKNRATKARAFSFNADANESERGERTGKIIAHLLWHIMMQVREI